MFMERVVTVCENCLLFANTSLLFALYPSAGSETKSRRVPVPITPTTFNNEATTIDDALHHGVLQIVESSSVIVKLAGMTSIERATGKEARSWSAFCL